MESVAKEGLIGVVGNVMVKELESWTYRSSSSSRSGCRTTSRRPCVK
jgi:hypothetical protein